ncbi:MAG: MFS transporter [Thermodesulfobacterium geofontis]|uniref:MFS transporter n=1 Tax=Thermodesulfobacterium geofontis TaxID=1295609 RepID=A0A2N7PQJ1_9BACT|nr:MAG: MFS transporter [Thermodesulfobacterium geofontis]
MSLIERNSIEVLFEEVHKLISPKERILITISVMVGTFMAILDTTIVDVTLPKMMGPLSTDLYGIQWVITSYMIAAATALLFVENFSKYIGYSYTFIVGMIIFTVSSFFCASATSLAQMIFFRSSQGIGEAFIMACAQTILMLVYPPEKRGTALGIYGLGVSFAPALGPTVGGFITEYLNWRWIFYINIPIGILNIISSLIVLPKFIGKLKTFKFNFISYFFIAGATIFLLIMLSKGQQYGWFQSTFIINCLFISLISFCLFFASELFASLKFKNTLINWEIFKFPEYTWSIGFYFFIVGFGMYQIFYLLPLYYENLKGLTTFQAGVHMLPPTMLIGFFSIISGILSDKLSPLPILFFNWIFFLIVTLFIIPNLNYYTPAYEAILLTLPLGVCIGTFFAPLTTLAMKNLGKLTGLGVALIHYIRFLGGSFGTAIATNHLNRHTNEFFLRTNELQNWFYVKQFIYSKIPFIEKFFFTPIAEKKAKVLLYHAQYIQALSWSFQETFRAVGFWGFIGGIFLIVLILIKINITKLY